MNKILIIEDNHDVNQALAEILTSEGYDTESVYTGIDGLNKLKSMEYQLVLLDIMLPYQSGDEVLRKLRTFSDIPVIIISAKDMVQTKIELLKLGADDYITKPFDLSEVVARVETNLRRTNLQQQKADVITYKNLTLDAQAKIVTVGDTVIELTATEYLLLELLMKNTNKVFTKANLYESVWQDEYLGDDNIIKTHISHLRTKLKHADSEQEYIETVWGLGYRMLTN